jgi:hypothetical protein
VEGWFAELTNPKLRRSEHRSITELETSIRAWTNAWTPTETIRADQDSRLDPRHPCRLLTTNQGLGTLDHLRQIANLHNINIPSIPADSHARLNDHAQVPVAGQMRQVQHRTSRLTNLQHP